MSKSVDASQMRKLNKVAVLRAIVEHDPISRIDIADKTDLHKATVTHLVDELIAEQFVCEVGYGESRGGRKPMLLSLNRTAGYTIGLDVQITHITAALCDLLGNVLYSRTCRTEYGAGQLNQDRLFTHLVDEIGHVLRRVPESPHGVLGIGVALPGMVNFETGFVHYLPNLEIHQWDLGPALTDRFGIPAFIDNDANCGAWAEYRSRRIPDLAFVNAGIGVGVGIMAGDSLFRGHHGIAGEFGHTSISAMGLQCACGSYGCWELYSSERALLRYIQEYGHLNDTEFPGADFVERCQAEALRGNTAYLHAFQSVAQHLGVGLANIANGLNPSMIIVGGNLMRAEQLILPDVKRYFQLRALPTNKDIPIVPASADSIVRGAASLVAWRVLSI
jgi:N-acetylglucosamine repressor